MTHQLHVTVWAGGEMLLAHAHAVVALQSASRGAGWSRLNNTAWRDHTDWWNAHCLDPSSLALKLCQLYNVCIKSECCRAF